MLLLQLVLLLLLLSWGTICIMVCTSPAPVLYSLVLRWGAHKLDADFVMYVIRSYTLGCIWCIATNYTTPPLEIRTGKL